MCSGRGERTSDDTGTTGTEDKVVDLLGGAATENLLEEATPVGGDSHLGGTEDRLDLLSLRGTSAELTEGKKTERRHRPDRGQQTPLQRNHTPAKRLQHNTRRLSAAAHRQQQARPSAGAASAAAERTHRDGDVVIVQDEGGVGHSQLFNLRGGWGGHDERCDCSVCARQKDAGGGLPPASLPFPIGKARSRRSVRSARSARYNARTTKSGISSGCLGPQGIGGSCYSGASLRESSSHLYALRA